MRCRALAEADPSTYVAFSAVGIKFLEMQRNRPRRNSAQTLAQALGASVENLFPSGFDDNVHNPTGKTRIPPDRRRRGFPKKD